MTNAIFKTNGKISGERLQVKTFKHADDMHKFLAQQSDNRWRVRVDTLGGLTLPEKSGTYARAGGKWHNVRTLDPSLLAHI